MDGSQMAFDVTASVCILKRAPWLIVDAIMDEFGTLVKTPKYSMSSSALVRGRTDFQSGGKGQFSVQRSTESLQDGINENLPT